MYLLYMTLAVVQWVSVFLALLIVVQSFFSLESQYRPCMQELDHEALLNVVAASTVCLFVAAVGWVAFLFAIGDDGVKKTFSVSRDLWKRGYKHKIAFGPPVFLFLLIVLVGVSLGTSGNLAYFNLVSPALLMHPEVGTTRSFVCTYSICDE